MALFVSWTEDMSVDTCFCADWQRGLKVMGWLSVSMDRLSLRGLDEAIGEEMSQLTLMLEGLSKKRDDLIKALQTIQEHEGYVSDEALAAIADHFSIPVVEVEGVVSFYAQFKRVKPGKYIISVCDGTACHIKGANLVSNWITDELGIRTGETDAEGRFSLESVACLGCCSLAPVVSINRRVYGNLDRKALIKILRRYQRGEVV